MKKEMTQFMVAGAVAAGIREAEQLAETFKVSKRTIYRHVKSPAFHAALDTIGYQGPRDLRNRPAREKPTSANEAFLIYLSLDRQLSRRTRARQIALRLNDGTRSSQAENWIRQWDRDAEEGE